ncbi:MAG: bifunctional ADP-dependent NAD(P)H-hydrate dehydratase/NAD(P)H-hydrate epimerase [Rhodobacterales bacterium]|nr:MAG: bifunctional ADP-dependent NAD(P)H-hydrate dehydratase/NAD(P)H-hydrate epimerase [Rhodobacterales bacterium]
MTQLLTAAQMRALEQAAIESGEVTGLELMERAGRGVVEAIFAEWPELAPAVSAGGGAAPTPPEYFGQDERTRRAVVLCGPGNNGGDGFVIARLLQARGWEVDVSLFGDAEKLPPDARKNYERWCAVGEVHCHAINPPPLVDDCLDFEGVFDLLVDALFGTGLARPLGGVFALLAMDGVKGGLRKNGVRVVAVDIPSGLCADSGRALGCSFTADLSVSFHGEKLGHRLAEGPAHCGKVVVADIGLEGSPAGLPVGIVQLVDGPGRDMAKHPWDHKYAHGHALILAGRAGKGGAARLAARGALRIGAGLVTVAPTPGALQENAAQLNAVMLNPAGDGKALAHILEDTRLNALCLGPGLGLDRACELVPAALGAKRATVLDADALTAYADAPDTLFAMLHEGCVLTPHTGEFARLFPDIAEKLSAPPTSGPAFSKLDATREAATRAGCTVLFKGPDTVIADQAGRAAVHAASCERAAPWLATAGSGDVLAGFVTGLLARGFAPRQAAETAAWLHAEAARGFGPGLIAEDLPEELPKVLKSLGL